MLIIVKKSKQLKAVKLKKTDKSRQIMFLVLVQNAFIK